MGAWAMAHVKKVFDDVDVIFTPATGTLPPEVRPEFLEHGESNVNLTGKIMRFAQLGNFLGLPGLVAPIGFTASNLPMSAQFQAPHWQEERLFKAARVVEKAFQMSVMRQPCMLIC